MILLRRIVLINWYLIDALDIDLRGGAAIIGENGVGKSSILDAVQVVMTANNRNYWRPNASSAPTTKSGGRKVRDYCLGQVNDPNLHPPRRENAITYICLVFEREAGDEGEPQAWTAGIALTASRSSPHEETEGLFIAPGLSMKAADFLDSAGEAKVLGTPREWSALRPKLERMSEGFEDFRRKPERFVEKLLQTLRGKRGYAEHRRFLKASRNAIAFQPIQDTTAFVRQYVLDDAPIEAKRLKDSVGTYRRLLATIESLETRETALTKVAGLFERHAEALQERNVAHWIAAQAEHGRAAARLAKEEAKRAEHASKLSDMEDAERLGREARASLREQIGEREAVLKTSDVALSLERTRFNLVSARGKRTELEKQKRALRALVEEAPSAFEAAAPGNEAARNALKRLEGAAGLDMGLNVWPPDPKALDEALDGLIEPLTAISASHVEARDRLGGERSAAERRGQELADQRNRMKQGQAPVSRSVRRLIEDLGERGLEPELLCSLVEVEDERWRLAVESLLGPARAAILVPPANAPEALKLLRARRREFMGCQVVNTTKTGGIGTYFDPRSLAAMVATENMHARAFLNLRLGGVICVETEDELLRERRAITPDCVYANALTIEARQAPDDMLLGKSILGRSLDAVESRIAAAAQEVEGLKREADRHGAMARRIDKLIGAIESRPQARDVTHRLNDVEATIGELERDVVSLEARQPTDLVEAVKILKEDLASLEADEAELRRERSTLDEQSGRIKETLKAAEETAVAIAAALDAATARVGDALAKAREEFDALKEKRLEDGEIAGHAGKRRAAAEQEAARLEEAARREVYEASRTFQLAFAVEAGASMGELEGWARHQLEAVQGHILRDYKPEVEQARAAMEEALREDLLTRLAAKFHDIDEKLRELNGQLKDRTFHREKYAFRKKENAAFVDIVRLAEHVYADPAGVAALFADPAAHGEDIARGVARIRDFIEAEDGEKDDLGEVGDYRQYFTFEVDTFDENGKPLSNLTARLAAGSGGEKQVPFYVAIAAALASTCHQRGAASRDELGFGLALFDEAFNNLDDANIANCLDFMRDLNLQVIAAAPESKRPQFMERLDTIISVYRAGDAVHIEVQHPGERARDLLRRENPANTSLATFRRAYEKARDGSAAEAAE